MSVTYLMQYSVQYIIAPVISDGKTKREISSFKHEKAQSRFEFSFSDSSSFLVGTELSKVTRTSSMPLWMYARFLFPPCWIYHVYLGPKCPSRNSSVACGFSLQTVWFGFQVEKNIGTNKNDLFSNIYIYSIYNIYTIASIPMEIMSCYNRFVTMYD